MYVAEDYEMVMLMRNAKIDREPYIHSSIIVREKKLTGSC